MYDENTNNLDFKNVQVDIEGDDVYFTINNIDYKESKTNELNFDRR